MIIGDPSRLAIESRLATAHNELSLRAVGFFVLHVGGRRYGVRAPEATFLACSFDEVQRRLEGRGKHLAPFSTEPDAGKIADAYLHAIYAPDQDDERFFGFSPTEFHRLLCARQITWAPDGDKAFDDGSFVLQFDVADRVRLIAFKWGKDYHHDPDSLSDVCLDAAEFYGLLEQWREAFQTAWTAAPKRAKPLGVTLFDASSKPPLT